ncbi:MAG: exopolysaccharide biosynthesis polyprenyl glycosylphosphotransferase [Actinobacteria bacterium]|nr:exopolysaccharide biosynthesis polyprenyl glycosylphosphotransferase [Actinomycetota bacterium]
MSSGLTDATAGHELSAPGTASLRAPDRGRQRWTKDSLRRRMLALADLGAAAAGVVALSATALDAGTALSAAVVAAPVWIVLAKVQGLYDADHRRLRHLTSDEIPSIFMWVTLSVATTALLLSLAGRPGLDGVAATAMWLAAFTTAVALRAAARALWRRVVPQELTLVLGDGELARTLVRKLRLEPGHHAALLSPGVLDERSPGGDLALDAVIRVRSVERVVVAREDLDEAGLLAVVRSCRATRTKLSVTPPLPAMFGTAVSLTHLAELPLIELRTWDPSRSTLLLKHAFDRTAAALVLVLLAPAMAAIALAIRLDSPGPVLFRQRRAGVDGRPFTMLKFRTMVADAERRLAELVDLDALDEPMFKLRDDPRVTRTGRWLRRLSLDELPQLLNVVAGHMSLVGPRPEEVRLVERYGEAERVRIQMRPGITGPMQVHGRGELTFAERVAIEREYVENHSLRKDASILLQTVGAVVAGRGAF